MIKSSNLKADEKMNFKQQQLYDFLKSKEMDKRKFLSDSMRLG